MKLILLHGPPAVGKYTTAKSLSSIIPAKILHNHLIVDLSLSIYDSFGEDDFFDFNTELRLMAINKALDLNCTYLVMTYCYSYPHDNSYLEKILVFCDKNSIDLRPVHISCDVDILFERVQNETRVKTNKVSEIKVLSDLLETRCYTAINHKNTISFNNSNISVENIAKEIVSRVTC